MSQDYTIITHKNISLSFSFSILFHVVILAVRYIVLPANNAPKIGTDLILFFLVDVALWTVCLVPLLAFIRGRLRWNDIYTIISFFNFMMIVSTFIIYIMFPESIFSYLDRRRLAYLSKDELLIFLCEADFLFIIFTSILLYTNRKVPKIIISPNHIKIDRRFIGPFVTSIITTALGVFAFIYIWSSSDFFYTLVLKMGLNITPEAGQGKYHLFVLIAIYCFPLLLIGLLVFTSRKKLLHKTTKNLSIFAIFCSVIPLLSFGNRTMIITVILTDLVILHRIGFLKMKKLQVLLSILVIFVMLYFITVIRSNRFLIGTPRDVVKSVFRGEITWSSNKERPPMESLFFHYERVLTTAWLIKHSRTTGNMIYGVSIISGPGRIFQDIMKRLFGVELGEPVWQANNFTYYWRFGSLKGNHSAQPVSLPGEFYLQFGYISLFILSIIYGKFIFWLRKKQDESTNFMNYFFFTLIAMYQILVVSTEISLMMYLVYPLLVIILIYNVVILFSPHKISNRYIYRPIRPKKVH